jgi:hypothetical protein
MERIAGITSNTIPWEILSAAGYSPCLLDDEPGPTPLADRFMEDVFDRRIRVIFDRLASGAWRHLDVVVIPRTSEQEHKLYLYLREVARLGLAPALPRLYLYNLLHTQTRESYDYGLERTRQMARDFPAPESALRDAIAENNRARAAVRQILRAREAGLIEGSAAVGMIRGFYTRNRMQFDAAVSAQLQHLPATCAGDRPRILIKGAACPVTLYELVERCGGYVVAEDDWRGSRAAGDQDIHPAGDPIVAIFEKYFHDAVSPRVHPPETADAWFRHEIEKSTAQGVLFYIPLEDDVAGWDYPRQLAFLCAKGVPSVVIRGSGTAGTCHEPAARLSDFVAELRRA